MTGVRFDVIPTRNYVIFVIAPLGGTGTTYEFDLTIPTGARLTKLGDWTPTARGWTTMILGVLAVGDQGGTVQLQARSQSGGAPSLSENTIMIGWETAPQSTEAELTTRNIRPPSPAPQRKPIHKRLWEALKGSK